jgi:hypothetical protein
MRRAWLQWPTVLHGTTRQVTVRVTVFDLEAIERLSEFAEDVIEDGFPTLLVNNAAWLLAVSSNS